MYCIIDNFLSTEDFNLFSSVTKKVSSSWMTDRDPRFGYWTKTIAKSKVENLEKEVDTVFHPIVWKTASLISDRLNQEISNLPPMFSLGYLFARNPYVVQKHLDLIYTDKKYHRTEYLKDSYSAFFYGHDYWDPNWGGYLGFHNDEHISIEPKPNRLVYYSLDEMHSVTQITKVKENPLRKLFKVTFYKITKERRHPMSNEDQIDYTMEI